ncbi:FAD-binding protein [Rubripirellula sp.]|nr:FAD-binding protein [Rubripirellula sp.]
MNDDRLIVESVDDLAKVVASESCVLPVGNCTKGPLAKANQCKRVSLQRLSGLIEYEPSEFTFTAWAGSTLSEIESELSDRGQYLPFDPMLSKAGATLGGTIASGLSGPGRFRYGGVRDFCIGVHWMDGRGRLVRGGGKVVKNAAGFDFPKFMAGSLGRYGILVDVTFKVFPKPAQSLTWSVTCSDHHAAMNAISKLASSRLEVDALDYRADLRELAVRLAGPADVLPALAQEVRRLMAGGQQLSDGDAIDYWESIKDFEWSGLENPLMIKVPLNLSKFLKLNESLQTNDQCHIHLSVGGNVGWIAIRDASLLTWLSKQLESQGLAGLVVGDREQKMQDLASNSNGGITTFQIGRWPASEMMQAVKKAMDPLSKFPGV